MLGDSLESITLNPYVIPKGGEKGDKIKILLKNMPVPKKRYRKWFGKGNKW